ncbi:MAG: bifunctional proline dehydrogenase/L-glutamate gamma-semialdehyde dehydrogenase PutA [Psychromonas sp.]|nr:bifunctional proline dehydrogenase/L-glutamate gamma-semialdehyde dehydrogenase PutA [Psychromonas sp.]
MLLFLPAETLKVSYIDKPLSELWDSISPLYMVDEGVLLKQLIPIATPSDQERVFIENKAMALVNRVRLDKNAVHLIDALLLEYSLDTKEGILLMCLAEALMRIPDTATADALIKDKLSVADWQSHLKKSDCVFVNASTWGLLLTGKVVSLNISKQDKSAHVIKRLVNKISEPIIRQVMNKAMQIMGHQFVLGRTIKEAKKNGLAFSKKGFLYSYDMLGESAVTAMDAKKYLLSYLDAIETLGAISNNKDNSTVSIKLSALHPRYEMANKERILSEMFVSVSGLIKRARALNVAITIDAEEADRLELSLILFEKLYRSDAAKGWGKLGLVVQAYSKRALAVLTWLAGLANAQGDCIALRLVKGAYWDSEIKLSQQKGYANYPVYTRKESTDVAYLACARFLLGVHLQGLIYPQFASHNAHSISAIVSMASHSNYEFQRLHGMGEALYDHVALMYSSKVRIYAPVGSHKDLLPYLVRRLLENGANSSFVNRLIDAKCPVSQLIEHPTNVLQSRSTLHNGLICLPPNIFNDRKNACNVNIDIESELFPFQKKIDFQMKKQWIGGSLLNGKKTLISKNKPLEQHQITTPYDRTIHVGEVVYASDKDVENALENAFRFYPTWSNVAVELRASYLQKLGDLLEENMPELIALCHKEAGKTIHDSIDEVREAVDFCRYYAQQAIDNFSGAQDLVGFDGVTRQIMRQGQGVFVCISPWNFPLAIFLGQVSAALVSGNTVVAKPAESTSLIAYRALELLLETGIDKQAIQLLVGTGGEIGAQLTSDKRVTGVVFTGSTATAQRINKTLANRGITPATLIAETGGQNVMIVDSTALPEQVVSDVIRSAFASAGQRCSALRVLFIQTDIADRVIELIQGAMDELAVGLPYLHRTDVGPVIDKNAKKQLLNHIDTLIKDNILVKKVSLSPDCDVGDFVPPTAIEIKHLSQLSKENFGPILHIIRYKANQLNAVIDQVNAAGFGLTMGIHSRNELNYLNIEKYSRVGNCYINRDQVGAVVGVQPFGGQGLSGTGPKAGGPRYLLRFTKPVILKNSQIV